ncbi:monooxygenase, putative [Streptomyces venezuelae]|nr:monooxygenase, putative [Streptomyces venezuelae]
MVIGGGQAGLAAGYYLRRQNLDFVILDAQPTTGGAWQHTWDSLRLFSPAAYSSLPGWLMPVQDGAEYPDADHVVRYLSAYEERYALPVQRPVQVEAVRRDGERLRVETDTGAWSAARCAAGGRRTSRGRGRQGERAATRSRSPRRPRGRTAALASSQGSGSSLSEEATPGHRSPPTSQRTRT